MMENMVLNSWAGAIERAKAKAVVSDLPEAVQLFRERTGQKPTHVFINPKNYHDFENAVPEDMVLEARGGCALWEIMVGCDNPVFPVGDTPPNPADNAQDEREGGAKIPTGKVPRRKNKTMIFAPKKKVKTSKVKRGRGRPPKKGNVSRWTKNRRWKKEEQLRMTI
ncbi:MAG: hypothetical protein PHG35_02030 [Dehalococcoidales bacterium]|nr:hypothetical protein [Dehalococcoidales bacterium]